MSLALFDIDHRVVFFEQGLGWLLAGQSPAGQKSLEKQLSALPLYGSDALYYCQEHAQSITAERALNELVSPVHLATLSDWMRQASHVEVF